jgi:energy-coupling factor transporter ATP-binding protein EcfA2
MAGLNNPFRGLLPFEEQHAALFFGRDKEIQEVASRLERQRLLAITGVSGSGKSSLVMAGVVPMLRAGLIPKLGTQVRVALMKPRGGPLFELQRQLSQALEREVKQEDLTRTTYGLVDVVKPLSPDESLLIVVDQFEEIFSYRKQHLSNDGGAVADRFMTLLLRATEQAEIPIFVVLTMRSDYLGACAVFRGLPEALNNAHYLVPKMTRLQLQEAIEEPLAAAGTSIHPGLVQQILNECEEEPDYLPVLQHLLFRMFEQGALASKLGPETKG